jgi:hypothetical protein
LIARAALLALPIAALAAGVAGVAGVASAATPAPPLGRLFFTPAERAALDAQRRAAARPAAAPPAAAASAPVAPRTLRVDGVVTRSGGPSTVWIDGVPLPPEGLAHGTRVERPADATQPVVVRLPDGGRRVPVRVGQEVEIGSGKVTERYLLASPPVVPDPSSPAWPGPPVEAPIPGARQPGARTAPERAGEDDGGERRRPAGRP